MDDDFDSRVFRSINRAASGVVRNLRELEPKPGQQVSHYRIVERLGAGGMGVVFKAEDTRLGRFVALKFLLPLASGDDAGRAQLEREARAASTLNHRAICTVHDVDLQHSPGFIVMELLEGETLKDRLARGPMSEPAALEVGRAVASALAAAHARGLVHCDVKPANVFITNDAAIKVLDFGVSRLPGMPGASAAAGTRAFMSPEQSAGEALDHRTDIYSFGLVMRAMVPSPSPRLGRAIAKMTDAVAGLRYQTMAEVSSVLADAERRRSTVFRRRLVAAAAFALAIGVGGWWVASQPSPMAERDLILIGDFDNRTGDPAFDDVLQDAVGVKFDQSPYVTVVPAARVEDALAQMRRPPEARITADVAREICERLGIKAFTVASIASLGSRYVVRLDVINAKSGSFMARQQVEAASQAEVLAAIDTAASATRRQLGESLQSVERFDVPLAVATTGSIEALRIFRQGLQVVAQGTSGALRASGLFQRAIDLDPEFALAYAQLGSSFRSMREYRKADEAMRHAFARRERASPRERLQIEANYYSQASGEISKAVETMQAWTQTYADDPRPENSLMAYYKDLGQLELAAEHGERAVAMLPSALYRANLAGAYVRTGQFELATKVAETTIRDSPDNATAHRILHTVARLTNNAPLAEREQAWMSRRTQDFNYVSYEANLAGSEGRLGDARRLFARAIQLTARAGFDDRPEQTRVRLALLEAYAGNRQAAARLAREVLATRPAAVVAADAAFALALAGDDEGAEVMAELVRTSPMNQYLTQLWQPLVAGLAAQARGDERRAVDAWQMADAYDRGDHAWLRPSYHIGLALLAAGDLDLARARFQKVITYRGVHFNRPLTALAYLGLARVDAAKGDAAIARASYDRFFKAWGTADAELPIMKAARAEYARLKPL
jgi:serine/threonine protein kinase/tetratricopeptide (TPR) repeat protein